MNKWYLRFKRVALGGASMVVLMQATTCTFDSQQFFNSSFNTIANSVTGLIVTTLLSEWLKVPVGSGF